MSSGDGARAAGVPGAAGAPAALAPAAGAPAGAGAARRARTLARLVALGVLALPGAYGCAPRPVAVAEVSADQIADRFRAAAARREALGRTAEAEVTMWARTARAWPAATAYLVLVSPDTVRLRVESAFGTALDGVARGESLFVRLPARRLGLAADAARDPLGLSHPGRLAFRVLAAAWRPPASAWAGAARAAGTLELRWAEEGDSLALRVDGEGLPVTLALARPDGARALVRYRAWRGRAPDAWPALIECEDGAARWSTRCRVDRTRFRDHPEPGRLEVRAAAGDQMLDWPGFRRALLGAEEER